MWTHPTAFPCFVPCTMGHNRSIHPSTRCVPREDNGPQSVLPRPVNQDLLRKTFVSKARYRRTSIPSSWCPLTNVWGVEMLNPCPIMQVLWLPGGLFSGQQEAQLPVVGLQISQVETEKRAAALPTSTTPAQYPWFSPPIRPRFSLFSLCWGFDSSTSCTHLLFPLFRQNWWPPLRGSPLSCCWLVPLC